jgi:hypothetical protein
MNKNGLDTERDFFVTGVKTYVDVDDAMTEFRRVVQHKCWTIVSRRLGEINEACGMRLTSTDLQDYEQKTDYHYIGKMVEVKGLGGLYFCLRLSRGDDSKRFDAYVFLYRARRDRATGLWDRSDSNPSVTYKGRNNLGLGRSIPKDKIPDFEGYLDGAITDFIAFIIESGGLKKYLVPDHKEV